MLYGNFKVSIAQIYIFLLSRDFFKNILVDTCPFYGATDTSVLDF